jgi:hypothetical protein
MRVLGVVLLVAAATSAVCGCHGPAAQGNGSPAPPDGSADAAATDAPDAGPGFASIKALRQAVPSPSTPVPVALGPTVVTGVRAPRKSYVWIADADGGPRSGLAVYCPPDTPQPCAPSGAADGGP